MTTEKSSAGALLQQVVRDLTRGARIELVLWDRGGPPGPGYESDQLTMRDDGSALNAAYLKTRFDDENPPFRGDEYQKAFPKLVGNEKLAKVIFGRTYAEEADPRIGGVTKITVTLRTRTDSMASAGSELSKTFFQRLPDELAALDKRFREMLRLCEAEGTHTRLARERA